MKALRFTILFSLSVNMCAQGSLDFESWKSGDPLPAPFHMAEQVPGNRWAIDTFRAIEGQRTLRHVYDNPGSGCDYFLLGHDPVSGDDSISLSFRIRHGYSPSSANNWQIAFLSSFIEEGAGPVITEGLVLGVNFTGSDDFVKIWRRCGDETDVICSTDLNFQEETGTENAAYFRAEIDRQGMLELSYSPDPVYIPERKLVRCGPLILPGGRRLVLRYEYSAAQDRKLWLDNILFEGNFVRDSLAPRLLGWSLPDEQSLRISFSEPIVPDSIFNPGDTIIYELLDSCLVLRWKKDLPNRRGIELRLSGICDMDYNCMADTMLVIMRNDAEWGDVVINELMPDPDPRAGTWLGEFVEIYNRSAYAIQLDKLVLQAGARNYSLLNEGKAGEEKKDEFLNLLLPGQYHVVRNLVLPNSGGELVLRDVRGQVIHAVQYRMPLEGAPWKGEGGWSLEAVDPDHFCSTSGQWVFSEDRSGGTPDRLNSMDGEWQDTEAPVLLYYGVDGEDSLRLHFSESLGKPGDLPASVRILPGDLSALNMYRDTPLGEQLLCVFGAGTLEKTGYRISIPAVKDCAGNHRWESLVLSGAVSPPEAGSVLINEIMFDPEEGKPEYIELYHPGPGFTDLEELAIGISDPGEEAEKHISLSEHSRILGGGEYIVLCKDSRELMADYQLELCGKWLSMPELFSMPGSGGQISLMDRSGSGIDMAIYNREMHMNQLEQVQGISLERISLKRSGTERMNWHSAASIQGYATPGRKNSQAMEDAGGSGCMEISPRVFSPGNDGYRDVQHIYIRGLRQGSLLRLWVTDLQGNPVRVLANNHIAGPDMLYHWNGLNDRGMTVRQGFYVIHMKAWNVDDGQKWQEREASGVAF